MGYTNNTNISEYALNIFLKFAKWFTSNSIYTKKI